MADFKCEPGKILSREEEEQYVAFRNGGVAPPDEYNDVVFDASHITGAVHRCKTTEEKDAEEAAAAAAAARAERVKAADEAVREVKEQRLAESGVIPAR